MARDTVTFIGKDGQELQVTKHISRDGLATLKKLGYTQEKRSKETKSG
jgi:hypothetical protein